MAPGGVEVGEPVGATHAEVLDTVDDLLARLGFDLVVVGDPEPLGAAVVVAEPQTVGDDFAEDLAVGDEVLVAEDEELLASFDQQGDKGPDEAPGRVGHHDVGFVQQVEALRTGEVAVALQGGHDVAVVAEQVLDVEQVDRPVVVAVRHLCDLDLVDLADGAGVLQPLDLEQRELLAGDGRAGVAGGDELLQPEVVEVHGEVLEEVALVGVVAVAEDDLAAQLVAVVAQLGLHVSERRVELVSGVAVPRAERLVSCHVPASLRPISRSERVYRGGPTGSGRLDWRAPCSQIPALASVMLPRLRGTCPVGARHRGCP